MNTNFRLHIVAFAVASVFIAMPKAHARGIPDFVASGKGKSTTISSASNGTPIVTSAPSALTPGGGWQQAGNYGVASSPSGGVKVGADAKVDVNGKGVPVGVVGEISKDMLIPAALSALSCIKGGVVGAAVCAGATIAAPIAMQWLANAGGRINPETKELERSNVQYRWRLTSGSSIDLGYWNSGSDACLFAPAVQTYLTDTANASWGTHTVQSQSWSAPFCIRMIKRANNSVEQVTAALQQTTDVRTGWLPASMDDIAPYMKNTPVSPMIVPELDAAGQASKLPIGSISVSGPAAVAGPTTTTVNNIDNSTKISTVTNNYTYNGSTVTNTGTQTKTETKKQDGTVTESTTDTTAPGDEQKPEEPAPVDTALPGLPKLYEAKYPDGLEGVWRDQKDKLKNTSLSQLTSQLMPQVGSGGSCPTMNIDLTFAQWASYGTRNIAPPCEVWDWARLIVIASALLLARALVFGG
ncbi:hypothetical protein [Variovorax sp. GB1P17]|uniref:hypothetical protein n=1 Tax=Variovorax sp. GB1P17 TaxID=3443740 RepID=UPI003F4857D3